MTEIRKGAAGGSRQSRGRGLGVSGGLLLLSTALMACGQQSPTPTAPASDVQLEAEEGIISPLAAPDVAEPRSGGRTIQDQAASGGRAVILLGTNDAVRFKLPGNFASGRYTVKVRGRGEFYQGWPVVALENDRRRRMSVTTLDTKSYGVRGFGEFDLRPNQEMYFTFLNDAYDGSGRDRNAVVDYLVIEPVRKTPPPSRAASFVSQFGTEGFDTAFDVAVDAAGNSYVVGSTNGSFPGQDTAGNSAFVRKVDPQGKELWTRQFGSASKVNAYDGPDLRSVAVDRDGNVYVAGGVAGALAGQTSAGAYDTFVRKYTPDGSEVWTRQFGTAGLDAPQKVGVDAGGNVYVVGVTAGILPGAQGYDGPTGDPGVPKIAFVRKYTANGDVGWTRQFAAVRRDPSSGQPVPDSSAESASVDASGNVYVVGTTFAAFPGQNLVGSPDAFVRKYTPDGAEAWTRQFGAKDAFTGVGASTFGLGIGVDAGGNSYVVGGTRGGVFPSPDNAGSGNNFLAKLGPTGSVVWTRQFGSSTTGFETFSELAINPAGDVFVAGRTEGIFPGQRTAGKEDLVVLKYGADGRALATRQLGSAGLDETLGLAVDANGVYLAGRTDGTFPGQTSAGATDALLIKFNSALDAVTPTPTVNQPPILTLRVDNGLGSNSASAYTSPNTFESDHNITLEATASDIDGAIARVEFYSGSRKIGEDTTAPYQLVLGNEGYVEDGPRGEPVSAVAVDDRGASTTTGNFFTTVNSTFASPNLRGVDFGAASSSYVNFTFFESGGAPGFTTNGTATVLDASRPLVPPVRDPAREALIRSSISRQGPLELNIPTPDGTYAVYLWVRAEDTTPYDLQMEGQNVYRFAPQEAGRWERVGPLRVAVRGGVLNVASTGSARANFSAIEYARLPQAGDVLPTVKFTGDLANGNPPADGRVSVDASSTGGKVVRVEFFIQDRFGSSDSRRVPPTKIGEATQAPYSVVWKDSPLSFQRVTAVVTDDTGARNFTTVTTGPIQSTP